jgi:hypothetical protein
MQDVTGGYAGLTLFTQYPSSIAENAHGIPLGVVGLC